MNLSKIPLQSVMENSVRLGETTDDGKLLTVAKRKTM